MKTTGKKPALWIFGILFAVGVAADQLLKYWAVSALSGGKTIPVIPGFFTLVYTENRGGVFGLMQGSSVIFLILTVLIAGALTWLMCKSRYFADFASRLCLTAVIAGGVGNAIDRAAREFVVDFMRFEVSFFPWIFNLADVFVVCGTLALIAIFLFSKKKNALFHADGEGREP